MGEFIIDRPGELNSIDRCLAFDPRYLDICIFVSIVLSRFASMPMAPLIFRVSEVPAWQVLLAGQASVE